MSHLATKPNYEKSVGEETERTEEEIKHEDCSFFGWRPGWIHYLVNPKMFLLNFSLIGVLRTAYFTYLISVMSTLEKRYAFPSKLSAFILIADNISGMIVSPFVGYFGSKFKGPTVIGCGMMLVSLSCILSGMPYLIYGPALHFLQEDATTIHSSFSKANLENGENYEMCGENVEQCAKGHPFQMGAYILLWIASFVNGLGYTTFWTIGLPYIDNNVKKKNSPIYLSVSTVVRLTGVTFGFFLSGFALRLYENPTYSIDLPRKDPRWVGAWWIGFFIFGILIFMCSLPMFIFPTSMKKKAVKVKSEAKMGFKDAFTTFKRVVTNPILVIDTIGGGIRYIGLAGYWISKPRYIEAQFHQSASSASILTGATSTIMKAVGILLGGLFISKFKPRPRLLVGLIVIVELSCNILIFSAMFFGCPSPHFDHIVLTEQGANLEQPCNKECDCSTKVFNPVCDMANSTNYFSPCFAGCTEFNVTKKPHTFMNCSCVGGEQRTLMSGFCENNCNALPGYLTAISLAGIISSLARTANVLIALRCVAPNDKSFAMGLVGSYMALFVFIPYPVVFGYVIDAACLVWERSCGETGNCWLYDTQKLRYYLHGTTFAFAMVGSCFDFVLFIFANRLNNMYDEEDEIDENEMQQRKEEEPLNKNNI
ncbi:Solute carrier organic anion transporter family member 5A1-like protein [Dinothrombium tinctorium]|uniref:Solute carrier organic anion transporter family member n=1 Tax=Dinothrombium tinctorium TaxID=1965070 RepID=A0A3S3PEZ4_9ACAR|nr:Solute carrier organic anion transporter family member 5A1-like protein [Dinothrombium tinctorium]